MVPIGKAGTDKAERQAQKGVVMVSPKLLENILGKPLTAEQQKSLEDAALAYQESVAKAAGLTVEELQAKTKEFHQAQKAAKAAKNAGAATPLK